MYGLDVLLLKLTDEMRRRRRTCDYGGHCMRQLFGCLVVDETYL
jgi:hypothetical protein